MKKGFSMPEHVVSEVYHLGRRWEIISRDANYFARLGQSDVGPYSTAEAAEDFIRG